MTTDSILIRARKNRTADYTLTLLDSSGAALTLATDDNCRVKIGRGSETPDIEADKDGVAYDSGTRVGSKTSWSSGSNIVTLHLEREDTSDVDPGAYDLEIIVVDSADSVKHVQSGVFSLAPSMGGEIDIEESSGGSSGSSASSSSS